MTDRRRLWFLVGAVVLGLSAFALYWFQPHKLFIDDTVDEALPGLVAPAAAVGNPTTTEPDPAPTDAAPAATPAPGTTPVTLPPSTTLPPTTTVPPTTADPRPASSLARAGEQAAALAAPVAASTGSFTSLDHPTSGQALVVVQPDGSRLLRLEALDTDNGPDLRVVLSTAPVGTGSYDGLIELGRLKGNKGSQNYEIPADVDLTTVASVVIWCERFSSPFGEAPIVVTP